LINEGGLATLSGRITEPDASDTFFLEVDWGDGTAPVVFTLPLGRNDFALKHAFTSAGRFIVTVTLIDDDEGLTFLTRRPVLQVV
jgi:hypothetical protein